MSLSENVSSAFKLINKLTKENKSLREEVERLKGEVLFGNHEIGTVKKIAKEFITEWAGKCERTEAERDEAIKALSVEITARAEAEAQRNNWAIKHKETMDKFKEMQAVVDELKEELADEKRLREYGLMLRRDIIRNLCDGTTELENDVTTMQAVVDAVVRWQKSRLRDDRSYLAYREATSAEINLYLVATEYVEQAIKEVEG